jgi:hypothetical protein
MRIKQVERYLAAKRKEPSTWGKLAFAFVEKSAEAGWNTELTELETIGQEVTWGHSYSSETMISYFGTQLPAREAQVRYKACQQDTSVADFVKRLKEQEPAEPGKSIRSLRRCMTSASKRTSAGSAAWRATVPRPARMASWTRMARRSTDLTHLGAASDSY